MSFLGPVAGFYITKVTNVALGTLACPVPVVAGDTVIVAGHIWRGGADPTPVVVTDTLGTVYTVVETTSMTWSGGTSRGIVAYGVVSAGGTPTVTVDPAGNGYISAGLTVVSGTLHVSGNASGTGTAAAASVTTTVPGCVVFGLVVCSSPSTSTTFANAAGQAQVYEDETNQQGPYCFSWKPAPTAGASTLSWTLGTSRDWRVLLFAFAAPAGTGLPDRAMTFLGGGGLTAGDVYGPMASTVDAVARFSDTTGKLLKDSTVSITDGASPIIRVGGATASFPALRRSGVQLEVVLADASAYAALRADPVQSLGGVHDYNRATPMGVWTNVPYLASNFLASAGTWTVEAADQSVFRYMLIGKTMWFDIRLLGTSTSAGMGNQLNITIPGGLSAVNASNGSMHLQMGGVFETGVWLANGGAISFFRTNYSTAFPSGLVNNFDIRFQGCIALV